jgi:Methyltransferase domain
VKRGRRFARRLVRNVRGAAASLAARARIVQGYRGLWRAPRSAVHYVLFDREMTNFTYEIANLGELAAVLGRAFDVPPADIESLVDELASDTDLSTELEMRLASRQDRNRRMPFGRRLGWYTIVRVCKPRLVVETGVHDGLGSTAILLALQRNALEGIDGRLVSMDLNDQSGWLIPERLRGRLELRFGRSLDVIAEALRTASVDVFIHDSDHRYDYELAELRAIREFAAPAIVYVSDNAHATTALRDFATDEGLAFEFWKEKPIGHFFEGAGIGLALRKPLGAASR